MNTKLLILCCAISAALAYPYEYEPEEYLIAAEPFEELAYTLDTVPQPEERVKRQLELQGGGGGSRGKGFDVSVDGRAPVWTSQNQRHSVDATAGYSQHLGGPYGNSPPEYRGGVGYTYRF